MPDRRSDENHPDLERFARLVRSHELELTRFLRSRVGRDAVGDLLQEVWEAAWRARADEELDLVCLLRLAQTRSARHHVKRRRRAWVQIDELELAAIGAEVETQVLTRERSELIRRTLASMSRRDQQVLNLALVIGLPHVDIARVLGLPTPNAASKAVSEARRRFRRAWVVSGA